MNTFREELGREMFWEYSDMVQTMPTDDMGFFPPTFRRRNGLFEGGFNEVLADNDWPLGPSRGHRFFIESRRWKRLRFIQTIKRFKTSHEFVDSLGPLSWVLFVNGKPGVDPCSFLRKKRQIDEGLCRDLWDQGHLPADVKNIVNQWTIYMDSKFNPDKKPSLFPLVEID